MLGASELTVGSNAANPGEESELRATTSLPLAGDITISPL